MKDRQLFSLFENDPELKSADFCEAYFSDDEFSKMCEGITLNTHLQFLYLLDSNITDTHLERLLHAILLNSSLKTIKISKFADYSEKSLEIINEIEKHVHSNATKSPSK